MQVSKTCKFLKHASFQNMQVSKTLQLSAVSSCLSAVFSCQLSPAFSCLQLSAVSSCQPFPAFSFLQLSAVSSFQLSPVFSCLQLSAVSVLNKLSFYIIITVMCTYYLFRGIPLDDEPKPQTEVQEVWGELYSTTVYGIKLLGPRSKVLEQIIGRKEKHSFFY